MTEITIQRLGHLGDGIAEGPIFAARTLPGEVVTGTLDGTRLEQPKIVTPSEDRVKAPCRHYASCGGCAVMHASDAFVAAWKRQIVVDALAAHRVKAEVLETQTSPVQSRRRATFSVRRTKAGALVGFHGRASETVLAVPECQLVTPGLRAAFPALEALGQLLCARKGEVAMTVTETESGLDVSAGPGKALDGPMRAALGQLAGQFGLARLTCDGELVAQAEPPRLAFDGIAVIPPAGAFLQATSHGEQALRRVVMDLTAGAKLIVDLFAGCGTFALPLARMAEVHGVEGDRAMTDALLAGWRGATGLKRVTAEARDLFRRPLMPDELKGFDAAVIDPPRAGAEAQVAELARSDVPVIAHVSCNPATFARDAATLIAAGFAMGPVHVVDQFRWSAHVEVVAGFSR
ncbi:class I SAM-dependent RNA methyltransferase [Pseudaestuariivita sp.]|uniref:class I SAM-dependent RNA methyltransferase n=1 Tax=Pseudaestuariivita sp. TaxID=2211669 RepID=UPI00405968CB